MLIVLNSTFSEYVLGDNIFIIICSMSRPILSRLGATTLWLNHSYAHPRILYDAESETTPHAPVLTMQCDWI